MLTSSAATNNRRFMAGSRRRQRGRQPLLDDVVDVHQVVGVEHHALEVALAVPHPDLLPVLHHVDLRTPERLARYGRSLRRW